MKEEVIGVVKVVYVDDFICRFLNGYDIVLNEEGFNIL